MLLKPYVESINKVFPKIREAEIIKQFDVSQKKFAKETRILETNAELSDVDSNISWALPSNFFELKGIDYYDSDDEPLYEGRDVFLTAEIEQGYLYFKTSNGDLLDGRLPEDIDSVIINYTYLPSDLTTIDSVFTITDLYRDGIRADVFAELYTTNPVQIQDRSGNFGLGINTSLIKLHGQKYAETVKRASKDRMVSGDNRSIGALNYQFAGKVILIKKQKPAASGTLVANTAMRLIYSKFVKFVITPGALTEATGTYGKFGFTGTFSGAFVAITDGDTLTITSTANDFDSGVTQVNITYGDANYQINSPTEMEFTLWDTWSEITLEIWER